ncbi:forkhead box protein R1 [Engraulis encrasicolus]|uniref:forkhead box protein R1 n=1 Tax=Engraulis encrasicolus TaxID=184585 RepID=UPI002FCF901D
MFMYFKNPERFLDLHLTTGLTDWDINEEINLTTTTDQFHQDGQRNEYLMQWHYARMSRRPSSVELANKYPKKSNENDIEPNLWLIVNPNLVCPVHPSKVAPKKTSVGEISTTTDHPFTNNHQLPYEPLTPVSPEPHDETQRGSVFSSKHMVSDDESSAEVEICRRVKVTRKAQVLKESERGGGGGGGRRRRGGGGGEGGGRGHWPCRQTRGRGRGRARRTLRDSEAFLSRAWAWPRPPINYCLLIAMALGRSHCGSLNVQQIYSFTREHFPFFQTAPDGWKNTIRHNLCFSTSFRKTPQQVSTAGGERKSCLWHLTPAGRSRHRYEIQMMSPDAMEELTRSMRHPDMVDQLLDL